ncbi:Replication factor A, C-terminal [Dillenia turbinata]|uniref:Replication factor A, C-terminal n=1 Tax=Dillenia turbinata TaxID=194707 RepID=A0AAN8ZA96_9MAGN
MVEERKAQRRFLFQRSTQRGWLFLVQNLPGSYFSHENCLFALCWFSASIRKKYAEMPYDKKVAVLARRRQVRLARKVQLANFDQEYFVWCGKTRTWFERKRGDVIGRMVTIDPKDGERYYLCLLLSHVDQLCFQRLKLLCKGPMQMINRCVLAPRNNAVDDINHLLIERFPGVDTIIEEIDDDIAVLPIKYDFTLFQDLGQHVDEKDAIIGSSYQGQINFKEIIQKYYHMACKKCFHAITATYHYEYTCNFCNEKQLAKPRYRFEVNLSDASGAITATLFEEMAEQIFGIIAIEAMKTPSKVHVENSSNLLTHPICESSGVLDSKEQNLNIQAYATDVTLPLLSPDTEKAASLDVCTSLTEKFRFEDLAASDDDSEERNPKRRKA